MNVIKCDRCGKIIENYNPRSRKYYIEKSESEYLVDLCDDCYDQIESLIEGKMPTMNLDKIKKIAEYVEMIMTDMPGTMEVLEQIKQELKEMEVKNE